MTLQALADHLAPVLDRARYHAEGDPAGIWIASPRPVRRVGLRLEAGPPPYDWADGLDAVLIHRPFGLWPARLPAGIGVLAVHRALDDRLAPGPSLALAAALGLDAEAEPLRRDGRSVGLVGRLRPASGAEVTARIVAELGGVEDAVGPEPARVEAVALVGAMTDALVREAASRGAGVYLTGQLRKPGVAAAEQAGVRVLAVGQDRAEAWGLRHLGALIRERWPETEIDASALPQVGAPPDGPSCDAPPPAEASGGA